MSGIKTTQGQINFDLVFLKKQEIATIRKGYNGIIISYGKIQKNLYIVHYQVNEPGIHRTNSRIVRLLRKKKLFCIKAAKKC